MEEEDTTSLLKLITQFRSEPSQISTNLQSDSLLKTSLSELSNNSNSISNVSFKKRKADDSSQCDDQINVSYCPSPWEFRHLRAELIESKAQIIRLEDRIDQLHRNSKEAVILFDREKNAMKSQVDFSRKQVEDLENKLKLMRQKETQTLSEIKGLKKELESEKLNHLQKETSLEHDNTLLAGKVSELENGTEESLVSLSQELKTVKEELEKKKTELCEKEDLCLSLEARLAVALEDQRDNEQMKIQLQEAELKIKDLEYKTADEEEARTMVNNLRTKVLKVEKIEAELDAKKDEVLKLREAIGRKLLLEEKVHDLEIKLGAVEDKEKELIELKASKTNLETQLEEWITLAANFVEEPNVLKLKFYVEELRRKELTSASELSQLTSKLHSSQKALNTCTDDMKKYKEQNTKLDDRMRRMSVENQILKKKLILVTRERDSYREQLDLYEKDLTLTSIDPDSNMKNMCTQQRAQIKNMEQSLCDYRLQLAAVEKLLAQSLRESTCIIDQNDSVRSLQREVEKLTNEVDNLKQMNNELNVQLENTISSQREKIDQPPPEKQRVVHMKLNPASLSHDKFMEEQESLRSECERLRARVKLLEQGESNMDLTQKVSETLRETHNKAVKALEEQLNSANLKMQRLKEVFKKTSQEFRDVCYMLLGYKIDVLSNKMYRLSSMFADLKDQHLMFKLSPNGMEMLETPFSKSLSNLVEKHLHRDNSIPAFLSTLTLTLMREEMEEEEDDVEEEQRQEYEDDEEDDDEYDDENMNVEEEELRNEEQEEYEEEEEQGDEDYQEDDRQNDEEEDDDDDDEDDVCIVDLT